MVKVLCNIFFYGPSCMQNILDTEMEAMNHILQVIKDKQLENKKVVFCSDSFETIDYFIKKFIHEYLRDSFMSTVDVEFLHVKREYNTLADQVAKKGLTSTI